MYGRKHYKSFSASNSLCGCKSDNLRKDTRLTKSLNNGRSNFGNKSRIVGEPTGTCASRRTKWKNETLLFRPNMNNMVVSLNWYLVCCNTSVRLVNKSDVDGNNFKNVLVCIENAQSVLLDKK